MDSPMPESDSTAVHSSSRRVSTSWGLHPSATSAKLAPRMSSTSNIAFVLRLGVIRMRGIRLTRIVGCRCAGFSREVRPSGRIEREMREGRDEWPGDAGGGGEQWDRARDGADAGPAGRAGDGG